MVLFCGGFGCVLFYVLRLFGVSRFDCCFSISLVFFCCGWFMFAWIGLAAVGYWRLLVVGLTCVVLIVVFVFVWLPLLVLLVLICVVRAAFLY